MKTRDFFYNLPDELIAQVPLKDRTTSRLLVLNKASGEVEHRYFKNVIEYLDKGDTLILNDTRVLAARLFGNRTGKKEKVEFLLLKRAQKNRTSFQNQI